MPEHRLHVGEGLLDLAIDEAQEVERDVELKQIGVDQNEVPDGHGAGRDLVARHDRDAGEPDRDDEPLADVQQRKAGLALYRRLLVEPARDIEAPRLVPLVAEILDRLVVEQAVDGLGVGLAVPLVHAPPVFQPPFGDREGEGDIEADGDEGHRRIGDAVEKPENAADHGDLHQGRQHVEQHEGEQELDPLDAAFDGAAEAPGAPLDMEAERELVQMVEDPQGNGADRPLADLGEDRIPELSESDGEHPERAIGEQDRHRHHDDGRRVVREDIDRILVEDRDVDVGHLGADEEDDGEHHAALHLQRAAQPEIGQQRANGVQVRAFPRGLRAGLAIESNHGAVSPVDRPAGGEAQSALRARVT